MNKDSKYAVQVVMYAIDWHYGDLGAYYPDGLKDKWLSKGRALNNYLELGFYLGKDHQPRYFNLLDWEQEKDKSPVAEFNNLNDLLNKERYTDLNKLLKNSDLSKRVYVSGHSYGGGDGFSTLDDAAESKEISNKSIAQALKELFEPIVPDVQGNYLAKVTIVAIGCNFANDTAEHLSRSPYSKSNANRLMHSIIDNNYGYWPDGVHGCFPWDIADDSSGYISGGYNIKNKLNHPILKGAKYSQNKRGGKYTGGLHKGFTTRYVFFSRDAETLKLCKVAKNPLPSLSTIKIKKIKGQSLALLEDWYINNKNIFPAHLPEFEGIICKISMNARLRFPQECVSKFLAEFFTNLQDLDQEQGKSSSDKYKAIEALKLSAKKLQKECMIDEYLVLLTQVGEQLETNHNLSKEDIYQPKNKWFDCCSVQDNKDKKLLLLYEYERLLYYYTSYHKDKKSSSLNAVKKHSQRIIQHQQKNNL